MAFDQHENSRHVPDFPWRFASPSLIDGSSMEHVDDPQLLLPPSVDVDDAWLLSTEHEAVLERFYQTLSPTSRRKRKNRDQMRRARLREKLKMDALRATVQRLEAQYDAMKEHSSSSAQSVEQYELLNEHHHHANATPTKYAALVTLSSHLTEENFRLKQEFHEKIKLRQTLERIVGDFIPTIALVAPERLVEPEKNAASPPEPSSSSTSMSMERVQRAVYDMHSHVSQLKHSPRLRAAPIVSFCDWNCRHRMEDQGGTLWCAFEKTFYHVSAHDAMMKMWSNERQMKTYRNKHVAVLQTMKILQDFNDDTYSFERKLFDPVTHNVVTSTYLRFRLLLSPNEGGGYMLGLSSLENQTANSTRAWASDLMLSTEFLPLEPNQEHALGFKVAVWLRTNVEGGCDGHHTAAELMIGMFRWENETIGPLFTLTASQNNQNNT